MTHVLLLLIPSPLVDIANQSWHNQSLLVSAETDTTNQLLLACSLSLTIPIRNLRPRDVK